jgi:lipopolysaccharide/colanic/teichoic acid biosynthesis glycosyltransferase
MSKVFRKEPADTLRPSDPFAVAGPPGSTQDYPSGHARSLSDGPVVRSGSVVSSNSGPAASGAAPRGPLYEGGSVIATAIEPARVLADQGEGAVGLFSIPRLPEKRYYEGLKRGMDIAGAVIGLVLFCPLIALCAVLVKLQDGGPVLFRQVRVGQWGREFVIFKFRSMVINAEAMQSALSDLNEHDDDRTFKILHDPRITPVGRLMRRMSLDELPQLWNVLRGEMAIVGPRPALPKEVAMYGRSDMIRLAVKPGLTCIWQVSGRSNLGFERQRQMDLEYIRRRSIWLDTMLIARTVPAVLCGEGAA